MFSSFLQGVFGELAGLWSGEKHTVERQNTRTRILLASCQGNGICYNQACIIKPETPAIANGVGTGCRIPGVFIRHRKTPETWYRTVFI
jgi:hypothetical protein